MRKYFKICDLCGKIVSKQELHKLILKKPDIKVSFKYQTWKTIFRKELCFECIKPVLVVMNKLDFKEDYKT